MEDCFKSDKWTEQQVIENDNNEEKHIRKALELHLTKTYLPDLITCGDETLVVLSTINTSLTSLVIQPSAQSPGLLKFTTLNTNQTNQTPLALWALVMAALAKRDVDIIPYHHQFIRAALPNSRSNNQVANPIEQEHLSKRLQNALETSVLWVLIYISLCISIIVS